MELCEYGSLHTTIQNSFLRDESFSMDIQKVPQSKITNNEY